MAKTKVKSYVRKSPCAGIYQSTVGHVTVIIKDRSYYNTDDKAVQKFLDVDPEIVLAEVAAVDNDDDADDDDVGDATDIDDADADDDDDDPGELDPGDSEPDKDD